MICRLFAKGLENILTTGSSLRAKEKRVRFYDLQISRLPNGPEVLELYRKRASREVDDGSMMLWRAFSKATWREPRGFAADADPMQIEQREELTSKCAGTVWRSTTNSQELAKIDPDTGLQVDNGPSLNCVIAVSVQRNFLHGTVYISYAQADARDTRTGLPVPEAPRTIWDAVASENHLPFHLQVRGEFEFVKAKPLGDGLVGVPVTEVRGAILRSFSENRMSLGANFLIAHGYMGQTTETIPFQPALCSTECVVGVPLKSYVSLSWTYLFQEIKQ